VVELNRRDGSACVLDIQEWAICDIDGRCLATEGIAKDVTAARQAEMEVRSLKDELGRRVALRTDELHRINEELRASEARYRNVVDTQSEFIVRWTPDGRRTFVNEPFCRFLGHAVEDLINKSVLPSIHPDDRHRLAKFISSLTPDAPHSVGETRMIASDGSVRWAQWSTQAFFDEHGQPVEFQSVGRDVTELKEAADLLRQKEAHLAHLSRLAVMGEMVAGIAHELSQPLHAATTFAEAARRHLESGRPGAAPSAIECCNEISISIQRTVEIIHRLREFTKASPVNMELLDLNDVVRGAIELMLYEIRRVNARLHVDLADGLPAVEGDRIQLEQVCVNLLKNACDALIGAPPGKGLLRVVTSQADGRLRLTIEDSGCGLGAADPARIFDAFYSTKPDGMGMGLSLCKSIAEAHNMQLGFASNRDGPGTTFYVTLPPAATRRT
jgi:PAS domain S-box-containing protein